jgi:FtsZ-binding cell division protein ZapB
MFMEMEFLSELENKIGTLVDAVSGLRSENEDLKRQIEELRTGADADKERLTEAAERVKGLLAKIDTAL